MAAANGRDPFPIRMLGVLVRELPGTPKSCVDLIISWSLLLAVLLLTPLGLLLQFSMCCQWCLRQMRGVVLKPDTRALMAAGGAWKIQVQVTLLSGRSVVINADSSWCIHNVKESLERSEGIPAAAQRLLQDSLVVSGETFLCEVSGGACVDFVLLTRSAECIKFLEKLASGQTTLESVPPSLCTDRECVLAAVKLSGSLLKYAPCFCDDAEVVRAAVQSDGTVLALASMRLRADAAIAAMAVSRNAEALLAITEPLCSDEEFLRCAWWLSSLDRQGGMVTDVDEVWQSRLYQQRSPMRNRFWSGLHRNLRKSAASSDLAVIIAILFLSKLSFSSYLILAVTLACYPLWAIIVRRFHDRMHEVLVDHMTRPMSRGDSIFCDNVPDCVKRLHWCISSKNPSEYV